MSKRALTSKSDAKKAARSRFYIEFFSAVGQCGPLGLNGIIQLANNSNYVGWTFIGFSVWSFLLSVVKAVFAANAELKQQPPNALTGALHAIHSMLTVGASPEAKLRICVFIPSKSPAETVHQLTEYVGYSGGSVGRDISARAGVVGEAFRTGNSCYDTLPKNKTVQEHLVTRGFQQSEASEKRKDAKVWAAIPVGGPEPSQVVAVLFLDVNVDKFFTKQRRLLLGAATEGVAKFVSLA